VFFSLFVFLSVFIYFLPKAFIIILQKIGFVNSRTEKFTFTSHKKNRRTRNRARRLKIYESEIKL